jgi:hypothetical protein
MILIAAILLRPWFVRVIAAPLEERIARLEFLFWFIVISVSVALLTASVLQMTPVVLPGPPLVRGRA